MAVEVMKPLYSPDGGAARGFACNLTVLNKETNPMTEDIRCTKVTRTQRGMWAHLRKHGVKKQADLPFEETKVA